ncbi:hypothetical protein GGR58DRAFT_497799 [Xylaria digitata]|nr:hypothetical protein GGR58DRAFT_497799 [Xylaria digitata]
MYQSTTTARSILQSILFQLVSKSTDAQVILAESKAQDIVGSTKDVSELLKTLLTSSRPTYIVIDGLDEIEAVERRILLQQLVDLASCLTIRILLSSRPEDDIANILTTKATGIRVDKRNSDSIRAYIEQRLRMFLYARIVLDNAEQFTSIQEIERELAVLPLDLNDAYGRIFSRINDSQPVLRRKARAILDPNARPSVIAPKNFVRRCGLILEVVDEIPKFVHFTVKDQNVDGFIGEADAHYDLTMSILKYLSSNIFNLDLSDEKLKENILAGKYRLQSFASSQWIALASRCAKESKDNASAHADLRTLLTRLILKLKNVEFEGKIDSLDVTYQIPHFRNSNVSNMMGGILQFRQDERHTDWTYDNSSTWVNFDPSTLSTTSTRIFNELEKAICAGGKHEAKCHCTLLHKHYETNMFKCIYPSCGLSRRGFQTRETRQDHVKIHSQPCKCSISSCPYAVIGFATGRDMYNHREKQHPSSTSSSPDDLPLSGFSWDNLELLAFDLTHAQKVGQLQKVVSYVGKNFKNFNLLWNARHLAVKMGSLQMLKTLTPPTTYECLNRNSKDYGREFVRNIVRTCHIAIFRWLLDSFCSFGSRLPYFTAIKENTESPFHRHVGEAEMLMPQYYKRSLLFSTLAFNATHKSAVHEEHLIQTWNRLITSLGVTALDKRFLGWSLTQLGKSSKSIRLAVELLRLGAPIDFPRDNSIKTPLTNPHESRQATYKRKEHQRTFRNRGHTAYYYATQATSERAAQFARFLLEQGADPRYKYKGMKLSRKERAALRQRVWDDGDDGDKDDEGDEEPRAKRRRTVKGKCGVRGVDIINISDEH